MELKSSKRDIRRARRQMLACAFAVLGAFALAWSGFGSEIEQQLQNGRETLLEKPASGELVIIEIDAKSLQAQNKWPWPRSLYAKAVDRMDAEGAAQIAFDIDFSSQSSPSQDAAFAESIAKANATVILPTFRQDASLGSETKTESLPIAELRENALIASVNVHPDKDGQVNDYSFGDITAGMPRPSLASMIAETSGHIRQSFSIDQSIDPASIPRISFADVLANRPLPVDISGKRVLIGATAIELGDRYPIRRSGVIPGVVIQALAAETLIQDTAVMHLGSILPLMLTALILFACLRVFEASKVTVAVIAIASGLFVILLALEALHLATFSIVPALFLLGLFLTFDKFFHTSMDLKTSQYFNAASGLPNEASFKKFVANFEANPIIVLRISNFGDALAMSDAESRSHLYQILSSRLNFLAAEGKVFHTQADTFAWIVKGDYVFDIEAHCQTAAALFQAPFVSGAKSVKLNAVFGISGSSIDTAKVAADNAAAKGIKWAWYDEETDQAIGLRQSLLVDLETALQNGDIGLVHQPKWDMQKDRLVGSEALVRWTHAEHGPVSPELFIPLLEAAGKIDAITKFVLQQALDDLVFWETARPGLNCSINISAQLLGDSKFVQAAIAMVEASNVPNAQITFEVTETATLADPDTAVLALDQIRETGIKVSIDDYGTGQSTLSYLQKLPADEIKIDQSFVRTMADDKANRILVQSTIQMGHALGLKVVAEGIEDDRTMTQLKEMGCDIGQGWHIAKPCPSVEFFAAFVEPDQPSSQSSV